MRDQMVAQNEIVDLISAEISKEYKKKSDIQLNIENL